MRNSIIRQILMFVVQIIILLISATTIEASNHSFDIYFEEADFEIVTNSNRQVDIQVRSTKTNYWFAGENCLALPLLSYNYGMPGNYDFKDFKIANKESHIIASDVKISKTLPYVPTDMSVDGPENIPVNCLELQYPEIPIFYNGSSNWNNITIFHFTMCPFEYDTETCSLYFIKHMTIQLEISDNVSRQMELGDSPEYAMSSINNTDFDHKTNFRNTLPYTSNDKIDYLIVTNEELKSNFTSLLKWKRRKGLSVQIVTTEEIANKYPDQSISLPLKIKKYLHDKYVNNQLEYVLLGGDDKIVPVLKCYCKANNREHINMPVDLFYSCFDGSFDWDGNNNGIYGEVDDSINFASSIFVSRIPVRNSDGISQYIKKLLEFEMSPKWNNEILMAGEQLSMIYKTGQSDAEAQAEKLYDSIRPLWDGKRVRLFDTNSDLGDIRFSKENLKNQISNGYGYIDVITHGTQISWIATNGNYTCQDGRSQTNIGNSVILTSSCNTNAFDCPYDIAGRPFSNDPCLSESLIRNYNSGVIAYWGSSRENWTNGWDNGTMDPSLTMELPFYKGLFGNQIAQKNFAKLIAFAKFANIQRAYVDLTYRWLQYSLNPIGDPEMCLYTTAPKKFENVRCTYTNNSVIFDTGVDSCKICVMSEHDDGLSYFKIFDNVKTVEISDIPDNVSICITKQNYVPKQLIITYLQDLTLNSDTHIVSDIVRIGKSANPTKKSGDVHVISGNLIIDAEKIEVVNGLEIHKGASVEFNHK